jgi:hypothetical protein
MKEGNRMWKVSRTKRNYIHGGLTQLMILYVIAHTPVAVSSRGIETMLPSSSEKLLLLKWLLTV